MSLENATPLPALYARWLDEIFGGPAPSERRATCHDCAMCKRADAGSQTFTEALFFRPDAKCCTYVPALPNFLVGRILADESPIAERGRASVAQRIAEGVGGTPIGLAMPPEYSLLYTNAEDAFGRSHELLCPHFVREDGSCAIWRHRNSVCSTWYCKFERGALGKQFWDATKNLLAAIEIELARWCVLQLNPGNDAIARLVRTKSWEDLSAPAPTEASLAGRRETSAYSRLWGRWSGSEITFYKQCAEIVGELDWQGVLRISGPSTRAFAEVAAKAYDLAHATASPQAVRLNSFQIISVKADLARLVTYSALDPIDVPAALLSVLHYFEGRPLEAALTAIRTERNIEIEVALVQRLTDFGLFSAVDPADPT
jgi:Fe-S-cluster containining protein